MIRMPLQDMIKRITEHTGMSEADILKKVDEKCAALSGLISKEGAAHIIANELGVKLLQNSGKIKDLLVGMRNADVLGKVTQIYETREFQRADGTAGKVGSFLVGDDTGIIRIVAWGKQADTLKDITQGMSIKITNGTVRENQRGYKELHLNDQSTINLNAQGAPEVLVKSAPIRKNLKDLAESEEITEIMGTIVQVFDPKFFEICPQCSSRLKEVEGHFTCEEHGAVKADYSYLVNVFLDDGTDNMRIVLFRNQAEKLLSKTKEHMIAYKQEPHTFEHMKTELLGEQYKFTGRAKKNTFFNRVEFIANTVEKAKAEEELAKLNSQ